MEEVKFFDFKDVDLCKHTCIYTSIEDTKLALFYTVHIQDSQDCTVIITNGLKKNGSIPSKENRFLFSLFSKMSQQVLGLTQPPIQREQMAPSVRVKWPGHETAHSPPSSAKVRNASSYTATPCSFTACTVTTLPFFHV